MSAPGAVGPASGGVLECLARAQHALQRAVHVALEGGCARELRGLVLDAEASLGALRCQLDRTLSLGGAP